MKKAVRIMWVIICEALVLPLRLLGILISVMFGIGQSVINKRNCLKPVMEGVAQGLYLTKVSYKAFIKYGNSCDMYDFMKEMSEG